MPIKKRKIEEPKPPLGIISGCKTYHHYREMMWGLIDRKGFNSHGSCFVTPAGDVPMRPDQFVLTPKKNLFFKDIWHCGSADTARDMTRYIASLPDVRYIEFKGRWVWVEWDHHGKDHILPGQPVEDRTKIRG